MPKLRTHARTSKSEAALVDEYGLDGLYGVDSVKSSRVIEFEVAVHFVGRDVMQLVPCRRTASSTLAVPTTLVLHERHRAFERVVVVRLGGEVHDQIVILHQRVERLHDRRCRH